jgi:hypothetical protein
MSLPRSTTRRVAMLSLLVLATGPLFAACGGDDATIADPTDTVDSGTPAAPDLAAPDETTGAETAGDETAGDETTGDETAGDETAGDEMTGAEEAAADLISGDASIEDVLGDVPMSSLLLGIEVALDPVSTEQIDENTGRVVFAEGSAFDDFNTACFVASSIVPEGKTITFVFPDGETTCD